MAKAYRFTPNRRTALRKAQLISARKRKGRGVSPKAKRIMKATGIAVATGAMLGTSAYAARQRHVRSGSSLTIHKGPRTATPMIRTVDKDGVKGILVPGTRAGFSLNNFGKKGFSFGYTNRNSKGDKLVFTYRHIPLPKGVGLFGKKIDSSPAEVTGWQPTTAAMPPLSEGKQLFDQINDPGKAALTYEGKAHRNAIQGTAKRDSGAKRSRDAKARQDKDVLTTRSLAGPRAGGSTLIFGNNIPEIEVRHRVDMYVKGMAKRGKPVNSVHRSEIASAFRKMVI